MIMRSVLSGLCLLLLAAIPVADGAQSEGGIRSAPARPQLPTPPYPYEQREVVVEHPDAFDIAGVLTIPQEDKFGPGPHPTALFISGLGQHDRDGTAVGHKLFLVIADYLTRRGIAVMRFDDRGVGGTGAGDTVATMTTEVSATDAKAIVEYLRTIDVVDSNRLGLIGHSEGGLIAPMVARNRDDIAFVVILAGPGVPGIELWPKYLELNWAARGADADAAARWVATSEEILRMVIDGADAEAVAPMMESLVLAQVESGLFPFTEDQARAAARSQAQFYAGPWMRFFLTYDPAPALRELKCPVFAVNGTLDFPVWHAQNLDAIRRTITEAGGDVTIKRYAGLNHRLQPARTGLPDEYASEEITIDEQVLADVAAWIGRHTTKTAH
jgi:pimeloyl-ACP methyl ester carboxylesterase